MSVKLNTRQVGDVTVIDVAGKITLGEGSSTLRDALRELSEDGEKLVRVEAKKGLDALKEKTRAAAS